jgi:hypothetical protein
MEGILFLSNPVTTHTASMKYSRTLATFTFALVFSAALSSAQTVITSLPYTINTPGVYVLNQSLHYTSGSGNAITVTASNVTINLNGYGITNTSDQTKTQARGISSNNVENLTVENGEIFGFFDGIILNGPNSGVSFNVGHVLQGLRLAYCTSVGIILANASNCVIQNCQLSSIGTTGGGVQVSGGAFGIEIVSLIGGNRVYRNQVLNATSVGFLGGAIGSQGGYWEQNLATTAPTDSFSQTRLKRTETICRAVQRARPLPAETISAGTIPSKLRVAARRVLRKGSHAKTPRRKG